MMRSIFKILASLVLASVMMLSIFSCKPADAEENDSETETKAETETETETLT